jgi:hypothetical protein
LAKGRTDREAEQDLRDVTGVWVTMWDTETDRNEFLDALDQGPMPAARTVLRLGQLGAVILLGFGETEVQALAGRLERSPLPMTKGGQPWSPGGRPTSHAGALRDPVRES